MWRVDDDRARLPKGLQDFIKFKKDGGSLLANAKQPSADILEKLLLEYLYSWVFNGPKTRINDGANDVDIDSFLTSGNLSNMFAVMTTFQGYDGSNTPHPI